MSNFTGNPSGVNDLMRQASASPAFRAEGERQLKVFWTAHRGRDVAAIQADYKRQFKGVLSDEGARLCSEGAPPLKLRSGK
jgi:hypothetical protein